jgi:hypothetical protein
MIPAPRTSHLGLLFALLATSGCQDTFYPLKNRITPGTDAFVVLVGDGQAGAGELWAGHGGGGNLFQVTYTLADEDLPALTPSGGVLAFLRAPTAADSTARRIWFMNLVTGAERELDALPDSSIPTRLAFNDTGDTLYARTPTGIWSIAAPPVVSPPRRLAASDSIRADSSLAVFLGEPKFARVGACTSTAGALCAFPPSGEVMWQEGGTDPVRWGSDSVGYLVGDRMIVRSGGGGRSREVRWTRVPPRLRRPTFAPPFRSP